jgi:WD40 repeat protein
MHIFSDSVIVIYADLSVGTYKWSPTSKRGRLKPDKLRHIARHELSMSRAVIKRGAAIPQSTTTGKWNLGVGNWSFAFTVGGAAKEELRQKSIMAPSRLMAAKVDSLSTVEASGFLVSCGYWDNLIKVHTLAGFRLLCGQNGGHRGPIRCLAIGQDGGLLITGGQDGTCRLWVIDHSDMAVALSDGYVQTALGSTNDGEQLLSCCRILWGHDSPISCLDLSSDLDVVVSGSLGGIVCVHTLRLGEYIRSFRPPPLSNKPSGVVKLSLHSHGRFVVHMEDCGLHTYTVNGVRLCSNDAGEKLHDMCMCSSGEILVTGGERCHVIIRRVNDLEILSMLDLSRHGPIRSISMTPDDLNPIPQVMLIGSDDGMITIIDEDPNYSGANNAETLTF